MDSSKTHERTINLGKLLVAALERDHSSKPVTHWMAHYIAELMVKAEDANGVEKEAAQKKCFDSIIMLWKHRAALPDGIRPFEAFEEVIKTLERLNPENRDSWMARFGGGTPESCDTEAKKILHVIESLDKSARSVLSTMLDEAVSACLDDETQTYLQNAKTGFEGKDLELILRLYQRTQAASAEELAQARRKSIQDQLHHLDHFLSGAKIVRELLASRMLGARIEDNERSGVES